MDEFSEIEDPPKAAVMLRRRMLRAVGEDEDTIEWGISREGSMRLVVDIGALRQAYGISEGHLAGRARVSHHTIRDSAKGVPSRPLRSSRSRGRPRI
jgi:hypothetical protein